MTRNLNRWGRPKDGRIIAIQGQASYDAMDPSVRPLWVEIDDDVTIAYDEKGAPTFPSYEGPEPELPPPPPLPPLAVAANKVAERIGLLDPSAPETAVILAGFVTMGWISAEEAAAAVSPPA